MFLAEANIIDSSDEDTLPPENHKRRSMFLKFCPTVDGEENNVGQGRMSYIAPAGGRPEGVAAVSGLYKKNVEVV